MGGKKSKMADKLQSIEKQERAGLSSHKFFDQLLGHAGFRAKFKVARKNPDDGRHVLTLSRAPGPEAGVRPISFY